VPVQNAQVRTHQFLQGMYSDGYFPDPIVDKGRAILLRLCERIEADRPGDLAALYALTSVATEEFNLLQDDFEAAESEIETVATLLEVLPDILIFEVDPEPCHHSVMLAHQHTPIECSAA